ncbi:hypothetical protein VPH35_072927 [Triticum aestivum]
MWLYSGPEDTTRVHPQEVTEEAEAQLLRNITGNNNNPRRAKRILPFHSKHLPGEDFTNMYSPVPNGEAHQGESEGSDDFEYANDSSDDICDDSDDEDEVESPPRTEHRSKQIQDPMDCHGKAAASSVKTQKRARTTTPDPSEKVSKQWCHFWSVPHGS